MASYVFELGDLILAASEGTNGRASAILSAFDRDSGRDRFNCTWDEPLASAVGRIGESLYFSTPSRIVSLSVKDGSTRFATPIPPALTSESGMPDLIGQYDVSLVLARESGVAMFDPKNGLMEFAYALPEGRGFTYAHVVKELWAAEEELIKNKASQKSKREVPAVAPISQSGWAYAMAQSNKRYVYTSSASVLRPGASSSAERISALNKRALASQAELAQGQAQAYLTMMNASVAMAQTVVAAIAAPIMKNTIEHSSIERQRRPNLKAAATMRNHLASLEGKYYLRPFYNGGWKLAVIDLERKARADILIFPPNRGLAIPLVMNLPAFAVNAERSLIAVKGLGPDPSRFTMYQMKSFDSSEDGSTVGYVIPYPSILFFDIRSLWFRDIPAKDADGSVPAPTAVDQALLAAIMAIDMKGVRAALAAGANPNAADVEGRTAIMLAIGSYNPEAIRLLGKGGADITTRDPEGFAAWYYFCTPVVDSGRFPDREGFKAMKEARTLYVRAAK